MLHLIGDVQGCCDAFDRLLAEIDFTPSRHRLVVLGDLVNRGPQSLRLLQRLRDFGDAATCLLGNHDLHLLAVAHGFRRPHRSDTFHDVLDSPQLDAWLDWLRHRPLAVVAGGWLCVHAGVAPQWTVERALQLAAEVQTMLQGADLPRFLATMYSNEPACWNERLDGHDRLRFIVNALTRLRFCTAEGLLDFDVKESATAAPPGFHPWFDVPARASAGQPIAFAHWSTLGLVSRPDLLGLDTGCVWGGRLTAVRVDGGRREVVQVECDMAQRPGT